MPDVEMKDAAGLEAVVLAQRDFALLLTFLRHQVVTGAAEDDDLAVALGSLVAEDMTGEGWTYAPETGKWYIVSRYPWEEGEPRGPLLVAMPAGFGGMLAEITGEIQRIEDEVRSELRTELMPGLAQAAEETLAFCTQCGRPLEAGLAFCTGCGNRVEEAPPAGPKCPGCGKEIEAGLAFCVFCGTRLKGDSDG